jgi:hypothetical protein
MLTIMPPTISSNVLQYHCLGLRHYTTTTTTLFAVGVENSRPQTVRRITPGGHEANDELGGGGLCSNSVKWSALFGVRVPFDLDDITLNLQTQKKSWI